MLLDISQQEIFTGSINIRFHSCDSPLSFSVCPISGNIIISVSEACSLSPHLTPQAMPRLRIMKEPLYWAHIIISVSEACSLSPHLAPQAMSRLRIMKEPLYWAHIIISLRKSSPYTARLNRLVFRLTESGITKYWQGDLARKYSSGCGTGPEYDDVPTKLLLGHVQGAFMLLGLGLVISSLVFLWEIIRHRKHASR